MIKVSVLYPNNEGSKFDMSYYCNSHMPMVQEKLGKACKGIAVEQGVSGATPGSRPGPGVRSALADFLDGGVPRESLTDSRGTSLRCGFSG